MYYKHGSANTLDRLLQQPQFSHLNNIQTMFQLSVDYVKIVNYMHNSSIGPLVMCYTPTLRKLLSQYLITDDFHLVVNELDSTPQVTRERGILCNWRQTRQFFAPEQRWRSISARLGSLYDKKIDIWKIPAVLERILDGVNGSISVKSKLEKIMERSTATADCARDATGVIESSATDHKIIY